MWGSNGGELPISQQSLWRAVHGHEVGVSELGQRRALCVCVCTRTRVCGGPARAGQHCMEHPQAPFLSEQSRAPPSPGMPRRPADARNRERMEQLSEEPACRRPAPRPLGKNTFPLLTPPVCAALSRRPQDPRPEPPQPPSWSTPLPGPQPRQVSLPPHPQTPDSLPEPHRGAERRGPTVPACTEQTADVRLRAIPRSSASLTGKLTGKLER